MAQYSFGNANGGGSFDKKSSGGSFSNVGNGERRSPSIAFDSLDDDRKKVYLDGHDAYLAENPDDEDGAQLAGEDKLFSWENEHQSMLPFAGDMAAYGIKQLTGLDVQNPFENYKGIDALQLGTGNTTLNMSFNDLGDKDKEVYIQGYDDYMAKHPDAKEDDLNAHLAGQSAVRSGWYKDRWNTTKNDGPQNPAYMAAEQERMEREQRERDDAATGAGAKVQQLVAQKELERALAEGSIRDEQLRQKAEQDLANIKNMNDQGLSLTQDGLAGVWQTVDAVRNEPAFDFGTMEPELAEARFLNTLEQAGGVEAIEDDTVRNEIKNVYDALNNPDSMRHYTQEDLKYWTGILEADMADKAHYQELQRQYNAGETNLTPDEALQQEREAFDQQRAQEERSKILQGMLYGGYGLAEAWKYMSDLPARGQDAAALAMNLWAGLEQGTVGMVKTLGEWISGETLYNLSGKQDWLRPAFRMEGTDYMKSLRERLNMDESTRQAMTADMLTRNQDALVPALVQLGVKEEDAKYALQFINEVTSGAFQNIGQMGYDIALGFASSGAGLLGSMKDAVTQQAAMKILAGNPAATAAGTSLMTQAANGIRAFFSNESAIPMIMSAYGRNLEEEAAKKGGADKLSAADNWYCLMDGILNSMIELGGGDVASGVQSAFDREARSGGFWLNKIKSIGGEVLEEEGQGIEQKVLSNLRDVMNGNMPEHSMFSFDDANAILSAAGAWDTMVTTAAQTTITGAVYDGAGKLSDVFNKIQTGQTLNRQETRMAMDAAEAAMRQNGVAAPTAEEAAFAAQESAETQGNNFENAVNGVSDRHAPGSVDQRAQAAVESSGEAAQAKAELDRAQAEFDEQQQLVLDTERHEFDPADLDAKLAVLTEKKNALDRARINYEQAQQAGERASSADEAEPSNEGETQTAEPPAQAQPSETPEALESRADTLEQMGAPQETVDALRQRAADARAQEAADAVKNQNDQADLRRQEEQKALQAQEEQRKAEIRLKRAQEARQQAEEAARQQGLQAKERKELEKMAGIARRQERRAQEAYNKALKAEEEQNQQADERKRQEEERQQAIDQNQMTAEKSGTQQAARDAEEQGRTGASPVKPAGNVRQEEEQAQNAGANRPESRKAAEIQETTEQDTQEPAAGGTEAYAGENATEGTSSVRSADTFPNGEGTAGEGEGAGPAEENSGVTSVQPDQETPAAEEGGSEGDTGTSSVTPDGVPPSPEGKADMAGEGEANITVQEDVDRTAETQRRAQQLIDDANRHADALGFGRYNGKNTAGVQIRSWDGEMSGAQRADLTAMDKFAKMSGFTVAMHSQLEGGLINGAYYKDEGGGRVIHIAQDNENPLRTTMGHELYHMLSNLNPTGAQKVAKVFEKWAERNGSDINEMIAKATEHYKNLADFKKLNPQEQRAYAYEEVVANSLLDVIGDEQSARALAMEDRGLAQRIHDWISRVMREIHDMLGNYAANSEEGRVFAQSEEALREMQETVRQALEETDALKKSVKAGKSLGSNSKMLGSFVSSLDAATGFDESNAAAQRLAAGILQANGLEVNDENMNTMMGVAQLAADGMMVSEAAMGTALDGKLKAGPETNRAVQALGRYQMSLLENGQAEMWEKLYENGAQIAEQNDQDAYQGTENASGFGPEAEQGARYSPKNHSSEESYTLRQQIRDNREQLDKEEIIAELSTKINLEEYFNKGARSPIAAMKLRAHEIISERYGDNVYRDGFGYVNLSKNNIYKGIGHVHTEKEALATIVVPDVIQKGILIENHEKHKKSDADSYTFGARVKIDGEPAYMGVVVRWSHKENRYRTHMILLPNEATLQIDENEKTGVAPEPRHSKDGMPARTAPVTNSKTQNDNEVKRSLKNNTKDTRYSLKSFDKPTETNSQLPTSMEDIYRRDYEINQELRDVQKQIKDYNNSEEVRDLMRRVSKADASEMDGLIQELGELEKRFNIREVKEKEAALKAEKEALKGQEDAVRRNQLVDEVQKSGKTEEEFFRDRAVKEFGYTSYFYDGGYILPNGKMLNFSGEKGKHFGTRGQDHRAISTIYDGVLGATESLNEFVNGGNVRIIDEGPGIDVSIGTELTDEQKATIRKHILRSGGNGYTVDLTGPDGKTVKTLEYDAGVKPDRVLWDIEDAQKNGVQEQRSLVADFHTRWSMKNGTDTGATEDRVAEERMLNEMQSDVAGNDPTAWSLLSALRDQKRRLTQNEDGNQEVTKGYWKKDVAKIAEAVAQDTGSTGKNKEIAKMLTDVYQDLDDFEGSDAAFFDHALQQAQALVTDIYKSQHREYNEAMLAEMGESGKQTLRDYFRGGYWYINPEMKQYIEQYIGSYADFRKTMNANGIRVTTVDKQKRSGSAYDLEYVWKAGDESGLYDKLGGEDTDSVGDILQKAYDAVTRDETEGSETLTMEEYALAGKIGMSVVADYLQAGAKVITTHSVEKIDDQHHRETVAKMEQLRNETEAQRDQIKRQTEQIDQLNGEIETLRSTVSKEISRYGELSRQFKDLKQNGAPMEEINQAKADMKAAMDAQLKAQEDLKKAQQKAEKQQQTIRDLRAQLKKTERAYDHAMDQLEDVGARRTENVSALEAKLREQYRMEYKDKIKEARARMKATQNRTKAVDSIRKTGATLKKWMEHPDTNRGYFQQENAAAAADLVEALVKNDGRKSAAKISRRLEEAIRQARESTDYRTQAMFDEGVNEDMREVTRLLEDKGSLRNLSDSDLEFVNGTLKTIAHQIRTANETIGRQKNQALSDESADMIRVSREKPQGMKGIGRMIRKGILTHLNPQRYFAIMGHHGDNAWTRMGEDLSEAQRKANKLYMDMTKNYEGLTQGENEKRFDRHTGKNATWYDTGIHILNEDGSDSGRTWKMNGGMRAYFALAWDSEQNREGMRAGVKNEQGQELYQLTIPDEELMKKGKEKEAYARGERVYFTEADAKAIIGEVTGYEQSWMNSWWGMEKLSKNAINEVSMLLNGFKKATVDGYVPIFRDPRYIGKDFETVVTDSRLTSMGFLKERVNAHNPMMLMDLTDVIKRQVRDVSTYYGFAVPVRNATRIYNGNMPGYATSVKEVINKTQGMEMGQYFEKLMADLQGGNRVESSPLDKLRGNVAGAVLSGNPSVIIKQAASYPAAASVLGWGPLLKGLKYFNPAGLKGIDVNKIDQYTSALWERRSRSLSDLEANANRNTKMSKAMHWLTNGIQGMDVATTKVIWKAAEYYVDEHNKNLTRGTEEYNQAVARIYEQALEGTQPEYGTMQRPGILRSQSQIVKSLTMYKTQSLQNFNILVDAATNLSDKAKAAKANNSAENQEALRAAKRQMATALSSQITSAVILGVMTAVGKALLHKLGGYRDDKGDLTAESVGSQILKDSASSVAGMVAGGSELFDLIAGVIEGKSPFDIEAAGVSTINDLYQNTYAFLDAMKVIGDSSLTDAQKMSQMWPKLRKLGMSVTQLLGLPVGNFANLIDGIAANAADFATGKAGSFASASPLQIAGTQIIGSAQGRETTNKAVAGYIAQAMMDGNEAEAVRLYNEQLRQGKTADALNTAIATWQKANIPEIRQAAEAIDNGDLSEYNRLINELTGMGLSMTNAVKYVEAERKKAEKTSSVTPDGATPSPEGKASGALTYQDIVAGMTKKESEQAYTNGMMNSLLEDGNIAGAMAVRDDMMANGKTQSSISSSLSNYWKPILQDAYNRGDMARVREITNMLVQMGMKHTTIQGWTSSSTSYSSSSSSFGKSSFGSGSFGKKKSSYSKKKSSFGSGSFGGKGFGK